MAKWHIHQPTSSTVILLQQLTRVHCTHLIASLIGSLTGAKVDKLRALIDDQLKAGEGQN